jgi:hypothetical protein
MPVGFHAQGTTPDLPLRAGAWRTLDTGQLPSIAPGATAEVGIAWQAPRIPAAATGWGLRATIGGDAEGQRLVVLSSIGRLTRPPRFDAVL